MPDESQSGAFDREIEEMWRTRVFSEAAAAYAAIAADPEAHAAWKAEIAAWDVTVGDGLPIELGARNEPELDSP